MSTVSMEQRCVAMMILAGVGDAMGFKGGDWEFCNSGAQIHHEMLQLTDGKGVDHLELSLPKFPVSDDTVMHIATAQALIESGKKNNGNKYCQLQDMMMICMAEHYIECMKNKYMRGRAPGETCTEGIEMIKRQGGASKWNQQPFSRYAGGCGAAMRSMVIGALYWQEEDIRGLIEVAIESARITHHHPSGYLGAVATAYFTSLAFQHVPIEQWGAKLLQLIEGPCYDYIKTSNRDVAQNLEAFADTIVKWRFYLQQRNLLVQNKDGLFGPVTFQTNTYMTNVEERDAFYKTLSYRGWAGSSGYDCAIIAYDALLGCERNWSTLCLWGMLHAGDGDSTGTVCGAWYGALYGLKHVPLCHYDDLEMKDELEQLGHELYELSFAQKGKS